MFGEGNGTPLQYSCLQNPMDRGAWWAAVYGVAPSRTRLKQLSRSSSKLYINETILNSKSLKHSKSLSLDEEVAQMSSQTLISENVNWFNHLGEICGKSKPHI